MTRRYNNPYSGHADEERARWHENELLKEELGGTRWEPRSRPMHKASPPLPPSCKLCAECYVAPASKRHIYRVTRADNASSFTAALDLCETCTPDRIFALPRASTLTPLNVLKLRGLWDPCFRCSKAEATATWHGVNPELRPRDFRVCSGCELDQPWAETWRFVVRYDPETE